MGGEACASGSSKFRSVFVDDELGDVTDRPRDTRRADRRGVLGLRAAAVAAAAAAAVTVCEYMTPRMHGR